MSTSIQDAPSPLTYEQWVHIISRNATDCDEANRRRQFPRFGMAGPAHLTVVIGAAAVTLTRTLVEASLTGMLVFSPESLASSTPVSVHVSIGDDSADVEGVVAHCAAASDGYRLGLKLAVDA